MERESGRERKWQTGRKRGRRKRRERGREKKWEGEGGRQLKKSWTHGWTNARMHGHSGDFILCPMLCIALDRQKYKFIQFRCPVCISG